MSEVPPATQKRFEFVGGALCLDFCNTVGGKRGQVEREYLQSYQDLLAWGVQARLLPKAAAARLAQSAARHPAGSRAVYQRALGLREAIYRVFLAIARGRKPAAADLECVNAELAQALGRLRVVPERDRFVWEWAGDPAALDRPLGPIARSAAELLTGPAGFSHVHQCEGETCGWLFVDSTKNHSRRWCDMGDCGNRAKVRRFRLKWRRARGRKLVS